MNFQPPFGPFGGQMQPQGPDYAYASAPSYAQTATMGGLSLGSGASAPFEYGGGQKLAPLMSGAAPPPSYRSGAGGSSSALMGGGSGSVAALIASNTNSKDPKALRARVFVGSLNTTTVTRDQLHQIYSPFGEILAISMHKGYAFVQYAFESEARNAVSFTDGSMMGGKRIDVTISSEPKASPSEEKFPPKRTANVTITPSGGSEPKKPRLAAPIAAFKKSTLTNSGGSSANKTGSAATKSVEAAKVESGVLGVGSALKQSTLSKGDDILICGTCRQLFSMLTQFSDHKASKCQAPGILVKPDDAENLDKEKNGLKSHKPDGEPLKLQCFICHSPFDYSWHLLQHMSQKHSMTVFESVDDETTGKVKKEA